MGVSIYLRDRRRVTLLIDGIAAEIGTLRRSWKVTELDNERAGEIERAKVDLQGQDAPLAVMVAELVELPLATAPDRLVQAHLVLGWDADRSSVTDYRWDHLPVLGYVVRSNTSPDYALHELKAGQLYPCSRQQTQEIGFWMAREVLFALGNHASSRAAPSSHISHFMPWPIAYSATAPQSKF